MLQSLRHIEGANDSRVTIHACRPRITVKGDLCQKFHSVCCHYVGYYSFYRVYSSVTSGIIRFIGYTLSLYRISLRRIFIRFVIVFGMSRAFDFRYAVLQVSLRD